MHVAARQGLQLLQGGCAPHRRIARLVACAVKKDGLTEVEWPSRAAPSRRRQHLHACCSKGTCILRQGEAGGERADGLQQRGILVPLCMTEQVLTARLVAAGCVKAFEETRCSMWKSLVTSGSHQACRRGLCVPSTYHILQERLLQKPHAQLRVSQCVRIVWHTQ